MNASSEVAVERPTARTETTRALVRAARRLHSIWSETRDPVARIEVAVGATLAAHAALDALLPDQARTRRVREGWRDGSVLARAARVTARLDQPLPAELGTLCMVRHSLGRAGAGTDASETREWLEGNGVARAIELVDLFERLCARNAR